MKTMGILLATCLLGVSAGTTEPTIVENRAIKLTQTVTLKDIPAGAKQVQLWVPIPSDTTWQRVVDRKVVSATGKWELVRQAEGRGDFIHATIADPKPGNAEVVVECIVERQGVKFPLENAAPAGEIQPELFQEALAESAPLMEVNDQIRSLADKICGAERNPAKQGIMLSKAVAEMADHYSKDPSKPNCGRGAAEDCLAHGGGCCTDLHSLFIALARARDLPARIQYGYRALDSKAGNAYDPGYRCWIEYFVPGAGWVPTDIVASDNADAANPLRWSSLSASKVWLWEGRSFTLTPKNASGPVHTMICGWAEIDGKPVDVLPAADKTPSRLGRTIKFEILSSDRKPDQPRLPE